MKMTPIPVLIAVATLCDIHVDRPVSHPLSLAILELAEQLAEHYEMPLDRFVEMTEAFRVVEQNRSTPETTGA